MRERESLNNGEGGRSTAKRNFAVGNGQALTA